MSKAGYLVGHNCGLQGDLWKKVVPFWKQDSEVLQVEYATLIRSIDLVFCWIDSFRKRGW